MDYLLIFARCFLGFLALLIFARLALTLVGFDHQYLSVRHFWDTPDGVRVINDGHREVPPDRTWYTDHHSARRTAPELVEGKEAHPSPTTSTRPLPKKHPETARTQP